MVSLRSLQTEFLTMSFLSLLQVKGIFLRLARDLVVNASPLHSSYRDASHRKNGKIPARTIVVHTKKKFHYKMQETCPSAHPHETCMKQTIGQPRMSPSAAFDRGLITHSNGSGCLR